MNSTIVILDWFNSHKEDIWASILTVVYALEKSGGIRTIAAKLLGPQSAQAEVPKQEKVEIK